MTDRPRRVFINYANEQYKIQQRFALWAAKKWGGFDEAIPYGPESIDEGFRKAHSGILSIKRGNGLWLWKPYILVNALERVNEGDYVFYCDSGGFFFRNVARLIQEMGDDDIWVSEILLIEEQWNKPEVFRLLGIEDREDIKKSRQIQAGFVLCRKSERSLKFAREWLELCTRPELIMPLEAGEYKGVCIEHREDQSLLSVLCKINGIKPHESPALLPPLLLKTKEEKLEKSSREIIFQHRLRRVRSMPDFVMKIFLRLIISSSLIRKIVNVKHRIFGVYTNESYTNC